ncbi:unnamed protein product [Closterium sp. NIES-54]
MPSLISILSSQSSSRFAHALSKESRVATAENASIKVPANLGLLFGPAAPSAFHMPAPSPFQQHVSSFPQQLQHQLYQLPLMPVAQQSIPRGIDSHGISANPADRCGLHLIRGDAFDLRPQDPSTTAVVSPADVAGDASISSSIRLADLISDYLEDCDEDGDALDGLTTLRTERSAQAQFHESRAGTATFLPATNPARSNLGSQGEDANQSMTDARTCHVNDLRGSSLNAAVAGRLRAMGYDAAVCTTQWDTSPTMPEGSYEYIDVLVSADPLARPPASASPCSTLVSSTSPAPASPSPTFNRTTSPRSSLPPCAAASVSADGASPSSASAIPQRFIVDLDFRAQFQIARPTREYASALESTPLIFVGRQERLVRLVEVVSGAMRGALRAQGMHIPPWRKGEYLHAKWMAAVTLRVVCEAKGMANGMGGEGGKSTGVVGKGNVGEGMERGAAVVGDKDTTTVVGSCNGGYGGKESQTTTLFTVTAASSTTDTAIAVMAAPAVSPLSACAAPPAPTAAPAGSFYATSASGIAGAAGAAHALRQQAQEARFTNASANPLELPPAAVPNPTEPPPKPPPPAPKAPVPAPKPPAPAPKPPVPAPKPPVPAPKPPAPAPIPLPPAPKPPRPAPNPPVKPPPVVAPNPPNPVPCPPPPFPPSVFPAPPPKPPLPASPLLDPNPPALDPSPTAPAAPAPPAPAAPPAFPPPSASVFFSPSPLTPKVLPAPPKVLPGPPKVLPAPPKVLPAPPKVLPAPPKVLPTPPKVLPAPPKVLPAPPKVLPAPPNRGAAEGAAGGAAEGAAAASAVTDAAAAAPPPPPPASVTEAAPVCANLATKPGADPIGADPKAGAAPNAGAAANAAVCSLPPAPAAPAADPPPPPASDPNACDPLRAPPAPPVATCL